VAAGKCESAGTWAYSDQYIGWHLVETTSALEGASNEFPLYATESYWTDNGSAPRRYTLPRDGFVSAEGPMSGGELITKLLVFSAGESQ